MKRQEPVEGNGRTHGIRQQADVRFGRQRLYERQLCEVQLTSGCDWTASLLQRLLPYRANWCYRPEAAARVRLLLVRKPTFNVRTRLVASPGGAEAPSR
jgi:hypothetical protein